MYTNFSIKVQFYCAGKKLPVVLMESLPAARVYANAVLQMSAATVAEIGPEDGPSEIMEREPHLSPYFPLADIAAMPVLPHTPNARLARHFQMAGAVDQGTVEQLAYLMRSRVPRPVARAKRQTIEFLHRGSAITDAELDVYRNSNQY